MSKTDWELEYRILKQEEPDAFRRAIQYSEAIASMRSLNVSFAAEIERAMVSLAIDILGLREKVRNG